MVQRLNFYDVYGYLIPGALLLGIVSLPFALTRSFSAAGFAEGLAFLIIAYIAGHLVQAVAESAISSKVPSMKRFRYPSEILLDPSEPRCLSAEIRASVVHIVSSVLNILPTSLDPDTPPKDTFLLGRSILIVHGANVYPEQFQALYSMMRGLVAVSALGISYILGLLSGITIPPLIETATAGLFDREGFLVLFFSLALLGAIYRFGQSSFERDASSEKHKVAAARYCLAASFFIATLIGSEMPILMDHLPAILAACPILALGLLIFRQMHQHFAVEFARHVYLSLCALASKAPLAASTEPKAPSLRRFLEGLWK